MWNQWILQNQWPWLLLCVGFSTKPQEGVSVEAVPRYPTPLPLGMLLTLGTAGAIPAPAAGTGGTQYFS